MKNKLTNLLCESVDKFLLEKDIGFKWIDNRYKVSALQAELYAAQTYFFWNQELNIRSIDRFW